MAAGIVVISGTKFQGSAAYSPRTTADDATPGTAINLECQYRTINMRFSRPLLDAIVTLCTVATAFAVQDVGAATGTVSYNGYMATGSVTSDPLYFITQQYAGQVVNTFGTGNAVTLDIKATDENLTFEARNNSARSTTFAIVHTPTSTWTTVNT